MAPQLRRTVSFSDLYHGPPVNELGGYTSLHDVYNSKLREMRMNYTEARIRLALKERDLWQARAGKATAERALDVLAKEVARQGRIQEEQGQVLQRILTIIEAQVTQTGLQEISPSILAQGNAPSPSALDTAVKDPLTLDEVLINPSLPSIPVSLTPQLDVENVREGPAYIKLQNMPKLDLQPSISDTVIEPRPLDRAQIREQAFMKLLNDSNSHHQEYVEETVTGPSELDVGKVQKQTLTNLVPAAVERPGKILVEEDKSKLKASSWALNPPAAQKDPQADQLFTSGASLRSDRASVPPSNFDRSSPRQGQKGNGKGKEEKLQLPPWLAALEEEKRALLAADEANLSQSEKEKRNPEDEYMKRQELEIKQGKKAAEVARDLVAAIETLPSRGNLMASRWATEAPAPLTTAPKASAPTAPAPTILVQNVSAPKVPAPSDSTPSSSEVIPQRSEHAIGSRSSLTTSSTPGQPGNATRNRLSRSMWGSTPPIPTPSPYEPRNIQGPSSAANRSATATPPSRGNKSKKSYKKEKFKYELPDFIVQHDKEKAEKAAKAKEAKDNPPS